MLNRTYKILVYKVGPENYIPVSVSMLAQGVYESTNPTLYPKKTTIRSLEIQLRKTPLWFDVERKIAIEHLHKCELKTISI